MMKTHFTVSESKLPGKENLHENQSQQSPFIPHKVGHGHCRAARSPTVETSSPGLGRHGAAG
jgi:hypothetical protein